MSEPNVYLMFHKRLREQDLDRIASAIREAWTPLRGDLDALSERVERLERGWVTSPTLANPEPVPEWRVLVDGVADGDPECRPYESPLASVLDHLTTLALEDLAAEGRKAALARIVAVCEAQVGDGWQADPSGWPTGAAHGLRGLIYVLGFNECWKPLGSRAAAWLRDLTEADA